ncbi:MAG TPA: DUF6542 domain-containing protein [Trebonia sp.]|nr:DUF6542 domain-containing protein [Trebonia sp.]
MSIPPGQEPRPGFTPRADQGRSGRRGDSGRPDGGYRRDDSGSRRPAQGPSGAGASGRGTAGGSRDTDRDNDDYWAGRPASGSRPGTRDAAASRDRDGYRDAGEQSARRPDGRYRNDGASRDSRAGRERGDRGWDGPTDWRDPRGGYRDGYGEGRNGTGRGAAAPTFTSRNAPATAATRPGTGPVRRRGLRWVGAWRERRAVLVLFGIALIGFVGTIVIGHDPGFLIGALLVVGSVVAAIGAQRRAVHKLIPLPALSYLVTTTVAGMVNDWSNLDDSKELATSFLTWIGGGFFGLVVATVLVVLITFIRWLGSRLLVSGRLPDPAPGPRRTESSPASRPRRDSAALGDSAPRDSDPRDSAPRDSAPRDSAPRDSAPRDSAPRDRAPRDRAPSGNAFGDNRRPRGAAGESPGPRGGPPRPDRGPRDPEDDPGDPRPPRDARRPRPTDSGPRDIWLSPRLEPLQRRVAQH